MAQAFVFVQLAVMLNLSFELLRLFSEGVLPATTIRCLASAAKQDGWGEGDALAERLATLGADGNHQQNCQRDLLRVCDSAGLMGACPEPYYVQAPGPGGIVRTLRVNLPHEQAQKTVMADGLDPYVVGQSSWDADVGVGRLLRVWGEEQEVDSRRALAIGLHADGFSYGASIRVGQCKSVIVAA